MRTTSSGSSEASVRAAVVRKRELAESSSRSSSARVEAAAVTRDAGVEQPELHEERVEARRRMEHLASVLVVDGVHEPLHELEPARRGIDVAACSRSTRRAAPR